LSGSKLFFYLCFQSAVEPVGIYFLVFQEFIVCNALTEFIGREEKIFYSMLFVSPGGTTGG